MIKAIIFDIGNVLLNFDYSVAFARLASQSGEISASLIASLEPLHRDLETGRVGRAEFVSRTAEAIGFTGTEAEFIAAWEPIFIENRPMTELVGRLQSRYPLYLLSNIGEIHHEYIFREFPVFGAFDDGVFSYRAGSMKPSREIYQIAVEQFGVNPSETLFFDDLAVNVAAGREAGLQAIQYDSRAHDLFLAALERAGVLQSGEFLLAEERL